MHPLSTDGGMQKVRVIYEPDLYRLIFGSKLKSAIKFQNWVFEEVLPKIRQQGYYSSNQKVALQDIYMTQKASTKWGGTNSFLKVIYCLHTNSQFPLVNPFFLCYPHMMNSQLELKLYYLCLLLRLR